jgi:hypothetical protein
MVFEFMEEEIIKLAAAAREIIESDTKRSEK